ncbi:PD-(D/E)XK nuclease family protein [Myroides sp.]|uniref:PD-(D/E)XK nuclease family protein n=1 Tax=Myroides sp. TaxID=1874736 RepID=UPI003F3F262B
MTQDINTPNIFDYATKELSQDAFLCWILSFAKPEYKRDYKNLHLLALDCFNQLLGFKEPITTLVIKTQVKSIDIWIEINGSHLIIIEDKTFSTLGNDQLERYYKVAEKEIQKLGFKSLNCVYFKSGIESENVFKKSEFSKFWTSKNLKDLMQIFQKYSTKIEHPFFRDFYNRSFERLSRHAEFYKYIKQDTLDVDTDVLEAFYKKLEADGVFTNWKYNDQRGTRAYYANDYEYCGVLPYVYIQLDRLELKLKIDLGELREERGKTYKKFQEKLRSKDIKSIFNKVYDLFAEDQKLSSKLLKQDRIYVHNFMILSKFDRTAWMVFNEQGELDYDATKGKFLQLREQVENRRIEVQEQIEDIANKVLR